MKQFLLFPLILLSFAVVGQTIVSTQPSNKNVVLEEYTGINCGYCPQGHAVANQISEGNPGRVVVINIHAGSFANPGTGQPDFRIPFGTSLLGQTGITGFPAGTVNRHVFPGFEMTSGKTGMGRGSWASASNTILGQSSYLNIGATAEIDFETRELTVYVEVYYTGSSPVSTNKLNVALLQNNTIGYQAGGSLDYKHMHRLVHLLSGQWGEEISTTTQGSLHTQTLTYTIPEAYNSIPAFLEDMEVAVFVAEGNHEIISGIQVEPEIVNVSAVDFQILSHNFPSELNIGKFTPSINVKSYGSEALTSLTITYQVNDCEPVNYDWTGELTFGNNTSITLPETPEFILFPQNTITVTITDEDGTPQNNTITSTIIKAPVTQSNDLVVEVKTDAYGSEIRWNIKNESNANVASGGPYADAVQTHTHNINLPEGKYTLTVTDSYGDGILSGGYVRLKAGTQTVVNIAGNSFGSSASKLFKVTAPVSLTFTPENESTGNSTEEPFTVEANKRLFASEWVVLNDDNISDHIILKINNENGDNIGFSATIDESGKLISVTPDDEISSGTSVFFGLSSDIHDEDGISPASSAVTFTIGTTSVNEIANSLVFVYPNPSDGNFKVGLDKNFGQVDIKIYSSTGSLVYAQNKTNSTEGVMLSLNLPAGIYFVTVTTTDGELMTKTIIIN